MNDSNAILQRDQMKKPTLQRCSNSNLCSPFPFREFGINTNSSLTHIFNQFPRETELFKHNNNQYKTEESIEISKDAYLKPLNIDRWKLSNQNQTEIPSFIKSSQINNNIRINDFSANKFLSFQSARSEIDKTTNEREKSKFFNKNTQNRAKTAILPLTKKRREIINSVDSVGENRAKSAVNLSKSIENMSETNFYLKSFKNDFLIYENRGKMFANETKKENNLIKNSESMKTVSSQSLYLQVKNDAAEYRRQRMKEANIDVDNIPKMKLVSVDDICVAENDDKNEKISDKKLEKNEKVVCESVDEKKISVQIEDEKKIERVPRAKSVTFNERVETREILEDSESDIEKSKSCEDSDNESSSEVESNGSVVSTDSESEDDKCKSPPIKPLNLQTPLSPISSFQNVLENENVQKDNNDDDSSSSEEEVDNSNNSHCLSNSATHNCKPSPNEELKSSNSSESESHSSSTFSSTFSKPKTPAIIHKPQINSVKPIRKVDLKKCSRVTMSQQDLKDMKVFKETQLNMPLIFSQFPFVPPVINFVGDGEKIEQLPWQLRKLLRWRTSLLTPVIVKQTITRSGFRPSRLTTATDDLENVETNDWILYFGKHMKGQIFLTLKDYQKVNHFPGSFQLGRKDRLWKNIYKMQQEVGKKEFDFIPQTFCLPTDLELFKQCWENGGNKHKWIIKPPASARGIGVKVVYKWNQIPKRRPIVVQRYISDPYLINESKFDLRLYVFLACIDPLRIYIYDDGLVRFASTKYTNSVKTLHNRFVHLTNYSVNKLNVEYLDNNDNEACKGHKWSLKSLWSYLRKRGVNTDTVWDRIKDLVVKTVISAEEMICASVKAYCKSPYNVKELFGFDVLLDEKLKPWILEVNVSPSLHSDTPLDVVVKGGMIKDVLNLSGFMLPELQDIDPPANPPSKPSSNKKLPSSDLHIDQRFWLHTPSENEDLKSKHFVSVATNGQTDKRFDINDTLPYQILDCLTPSDVRCLVDSYDEYERKGHFQRIYPIPSTVLMKKYLSCCERVRYSNLLLATFITKYNRNGQDVRLLEKLCQKKLHLLSSERGDKIDSKHIWHKTSYSGDN